MSYIVWSWLKGCNDQLCMYVIREGAKMFRGSYMFPKHEYIISNYNTSVRIMNLVSPTYYVVCINFIHGCRDLQLKTEVSNEYSKRWIDSSPTHNFWYLYTFIIILTSYSYYSYSSEYCSVCTRIILILCFV